MELLKRFDIQRIKTPQGILSLVCASLTWIGCIIGWSQNFSTAVSINWAIAVLFLSATLNAVGYYFGTASLHRLTFGAVWWILPFCIADGVLLGNAAANTGFAFATIGVLLSFFSYPGVTLANKKTDKWSLLAFIGVGLFGFIGMSTGAAYGYHHPYFLQATVSGFMTCIFWFAVTFLDIKAEKYFILFVASWLFPLSMASFLDSLTPVHAHPATIASGVFYLFASTIMIVWTGWDLSVAKTEASVRANAEDDVPRHGLDLPFIASQVKSIRGIVVGIAFLLNFVGVICIWASHASARYSWLAFVMLVIGSLQFYSVINGSMVLRIISLGMIFTTFPELTYIPKVSTHVTLVAGIVICFIAMFAQLATIPLKLDKEMSRHILSAAGIFGMIGMIGSILNGAVVIAPDFFLKYELSGRSVLVSFMFVAWAVMSYETELGGVPFAIGVIFAHSLTAAQINIAPSAAMVFGAVIIWLAAAGMCVVYTIKTAFVDDSTSTSGDDSETRPIFGGDRYPPAETPTLPPYSPEGSRHASFVGDPSVSIRDEGQVQIDVPQQQQQQQYQQPPQYEQQYQQQPQGGYTSIDDDGAPPQRQEEEQEEILTEESLP